MRLLKQALNGALFLLLGACSHTSAEQSIAAAVDIYSASDEMFATPYIDVDEWRDAPRRHRYVHGGFEQTDTRFSFYFPPADEYEGRFFQYVTPVPDNENLAQNPDNSDDKIGFSIASGAYFVETNGGGTSAMAGPGLTPDPTIGAYRANAATARFSRFVAEQMYGTGRPFGYIYGGSGGGYRTMGSLENTDGVWDGGVPFVLGTPVAAPNSFTVRMHAMRVLDGQFPQIVDAMDAGGGGDPYDKLNEEQRAALLEASRMGFPLGSWFDYDTMGVHAFTAIYQGMVMADPQYFEDFWTKPGYLGFDSPESLRDARLQFETTITQPLSAHEALEAGLPDITISGTARGAADTAWQAVINNGSVRPVAYVLGEAPPNVGFLGGEIEVLTGEASGSRIAVRAIQNDMITLGVVDPRVISSIKPGDRVRIDNSNFLAAQTYHRHQVPDLSHRGWDQFRDEKGEPIYPQRPMQLGPLFAQGAAGTVPSGRFNGKIILVGSAYDREAFPQFSDWYRRKFDDLYGETAADRYRIWYTDRALHGANEDEHNPTRVVSYTPVLEQALRDVAAWVENGVEPPSNTSYDIVDGQLVLPATAAERAGIQPVITIKANGAEVAMADPGEEVEIVAGVSVPPGTGQIVWAGWDFSGYGRFVDIEEASEHPAEQGQFSTKVSFDQPGTYFVTLKVMSQRQGDVASPYARVANLARVRIVIQ